MNDGRINAYEERISRVCEYIYQNLKLVHEVEECDLITDVYLPLK